nr:MAG TPA: hypothetical protein [Caudoviricetes sp.]
MKQYFSLPYVSLFFLFFLLITQPVLIISVNRRVT